MNLAPLTHWYGICERSSLSAFAEPLNVLSSFAFIIAAVAIYRQYKRHEDLRGKWIWDIRVLTLLTFIIGINSIAFHAFPNPTTELADTLTIVMFIIIYFWCVLFRIGRTTWFQAGICFVAFVGFSHILVSQFPRALNDSIGYLSTMIALIMIAVHLHLKARPSSSHFMLAALIGVVSLFCRAIDREVCPMFPIGSHFAWHTLNATLIYILLKQLIRNVNRVARLKRMAGDSTMI
ncbi:MAG: ceramidase domain-containing protein [Rickettsiales bacterium]|nr:ceramidase domain-containing protein [Rickettsiales bacterium]